MTHLADLDLPPSPLNMRYAVTRPQAGELFLDGPRRRWVAIVGAGYGREYAPLMDPRWEVWALNVIPPIDAEGRLRADRWFELHQRHAQSADDMRWIAKCPVPIYVPDDLMDASPNAVAYPLAQIEERFCKYWACTFAYQIALAIEDGFERIGLFGVDLSRGTARERTVEWACVSFWVGVAGASGVQISTPPGSRLGKHQHRYGLEYDAEKSEVEGYVAISGGFDEGQGG
jgi:hypothetical protein